MKIVKEFQPKIFIFTAVKNRCMLHGRVFVIYSLFIMCLNDWLLRSPFLNDCHGTKKKKLTKSI